MWVDLGGHRDRMPRAGGSLRPGNKDKLIDSILYEWGRVVFGGWARPWCFKCIIYLVRGDGMRRARLFPLLIWKGKENGNVAIFIGHTFCGRVVLRYNPYAWEEGNRRSRGLYLMPCRLHSDNHGRLGFPESERRGWDGSSHKRIK